MGNLEDWEILAAGAGTSQYFGMIDRTVIYGDGLTAKRLAGEKRPAFYALKTVIGNHDGFDSVERLDYGNVEVYIYKFVKDGKKIFVAWYDDEKFYGLGNASPVKNVEIAWDVVGSATIKEIPSVRNQEPQAEQAMPSNGKIAFELGYVPVFITEN